MDEITHRFSRANADGSLQDLLVKLGWESLLSPESEPLFTFENGKVLVIGEQTVGIEQLRLTAKKLGFDVDRFEFVLDYERAQTFEYYKSVGCYLLAHIVDLDTHKENFRVFRCERQGYLEKKLVLNPSYTAEEYICVYDSIESTEGRTILHTEGIDWMEYVSSRV